MEIKTFAETYNLKARLDGCGDTIIPGKRYRTPESRLENHCHIYDGFMGDQLGVCLIYSHGRRLAEAMRKMDAAGFQRRQVGQHDACYSFDATDRRQINLALKLAGIKYKRIVSPATMAAGRATQFKASSQGIQMPLVVPA